MDGFDIALIMTDFAFTLRIDAAAEVGDIQDFFIAVCAGVPVKCGIMLVNILRVFVKDAKTSRSVNRRAAGIANLTISAYDDVILNEQLLVASIADPPVLGFGIAARIVGNLVNRLQIGAVYAAQAAYARSSA